jgi:hypothetical protein
VHVLRIAHSLLAVQVRSWPNAAAPFLWGLAGHKKLHSVFRSKAVTRSS